MDGFSGRKVGASRKFVPLCRLGSRLVKKVTPRSLLSFRHAHCPEGGLKMHKDLYSECTEVRLTGATGHASGDL
jgi:hypothetical protein